MQARTPAELEMQIMDIVWNQESCSVSEIYNKLKSQRSIAYTTVATVLQRLYDKGIVERKQVQKQNIYSPKVSKKEYSSKVIKGFLNKIVDTFGDVALTSFAESIDDLPKEKKESLLTVIQEYEKGS